MALKTLVALIDALNLEYYYYHQHIGGTHFVELQIYPKGTSTPLLFLYQWDNDDFNPVTAVADMRRRLYV